MSPKCALTAAYLQFWASLFARIFEYSLTTLDAVPMRGWNPESDAVVRFSLTYLLSVLFKIEKRACVSGHPVYCDEYINNDKIQIINKK